jgi:hypothetical protein
MCRCVHVAAVELDCVNIYTMDKDTADRFEVWGVQPGFGTDVRHAVSVALLAAVSLFAPFVLVAYGVVPDVLRPALSFAVMLMWVPGPWSIPAAAMSDWRDACAPGASRLVRARMLPGHLFRVVPVTTVVSVVALGAAVAVTAF